MMIRYTRRREGSGSMTCSALKRHGEARRGFTLIETALATIIVGVGVVAIVSAQQAFHIKNNWSTHASTATLLGNEIREMTLNLPRHDPVTGQAYWGSEPNETWVGDFDDIDGEIERYRKYEQAGFTDLVLKIFDEPMAAVKTICERVVPAF